MFYVDISFTTKCDMSCDYCINKYIKKSDMSLNNMDKVLYFLKRNLGFINILTFNGIGNFFLYRHIDILYQKLKKEWLKYLDKKLLLSTKFINFREDILVDLLNNYFFSVKNLIISIDVNLFFSNFIYKKKLIKNLFKYKGLLPYFSVELINYKSYCDLERIKKFLFYFKFKDIVVEKFHNWGGFFKDYKNGGIRILRNYNDNCYNYLPLYISPEGHIYFCILKARDRRAIVGHISKDYKYSIFSIFERYNKKKWLCSTCSGRDSCYFYLNYCKIEK